MMKKKKINFDDIKDGDDIYLGYSEIIDISPIRKFTSTKEIDLSYNPIKDISPLKNLSKLERIDLRNTDIIDITPLDNLINLRVIFLNNTKVIDLNPLSKLKKLQVLILSNTFVEDIAPIASLAELQILFLDNTNIRSLYPLKSLIQSGLNVRLDSWEKASGHGIFVNNCPLSTPPISTIKNGHDAILNYFNQIEEQNSEPIHEARLLIVGEPGAGKTSLLRKLRDPTYRVIENNIDSESTVGINIYNGWSFPYKKNLKQIFNANLWDFGGQEIQYMTHQFFLSGRSLYVLVADDRTQNTNFPYWFEAIHLFGKDSGNIQSPILVLLNEKNHKSVSNYNHSKFCELYPQTKIECLSIDLSINDTRFYNSVELIQNMLSNLHHVGNLLPKLWNPIRDDLQILSETHNHISDDTMKGICRKRGLYDNLSISVLCSYLHDFGIILNFQEDRNLRDFIVLNPTWAVDAVYSILKDDRIDKNTGRFSEGFLSEIWDGRYTFTEQKNLLSLMMKDKFEICYEYAKGQFVAPQFLKDIKIDHNFDFSNSIKFYFQYDFMPKGIITRLIVRLNEFIAYEEGQTLVSKKGVILSKEGCKGFVRETDFENKGEIIIDVIGNDNRREVMWWLRNEIKVIHDKWYNSIEPKMYIPCICKECQDLTKPHFYAFLYLKKCLEKGKVTVTCESSLLEVEVIALIDGVFTKSESRNMQAQLGKMFRKIQKELESLKNEILILSKYIGELNSEESLIVNELILERVTNLEEKLPKEIINELKEANKASAYKVDNKDKLKLMLPIIPKLLVYEKEYSIDGKKVFDDIVNNLKDVYEKRKSFKELFFTN